MSKNLLEMIVGVLYGAVFGALFLGAPGCGGKVFTETQPQVGNSTADGSNPDLSSVVGAGWELRVDRAWNHSLFSDSGWDDLPEVDYVPASNGARYAVDFSADGLSVTVSGAMKGIATSGGTAKRSYPLEGGTFAGGRFVVWVSGSLLQGELTLDGSGVPIISSERGKLVKKQ